MDINPQRAVGLRVLQKATQFIDVAGWEPVDGFGIYPEGSRDKKLLMSPSEPPFDFVIPKRKFLLKYSRARCPHQFWCEILAYRLGILAGVPVPPAHCAIDRDGLCAALIEWFLDDELREANNVQSRRERKFSGGDLLQSIDPDFEREKGGRHSWQLVKKFFTESESIKDWKKTWFEMLAFDAFIGNTDRHQENWVLIMTSWWQDTPQFNFRIGPFFDHGTALGYEQPEDKVSRLTGDLLETYVRRGRGHLKWEPTDPKGKKHFDLIGQLLNEEFPEGREVLLRYAEISEASIYETCVELCNFNIPERLSRPRAEFMARLVDLRRRKLLEIANDTH